MQKERILADNLKIKRITAQDSFIPLGKAAEYVLPSVEDIVRGVLELG